jgi:RNA polymerase sigma-70 factor (ECF subfamily)
LKHYSSISADELIRECAQSSDPSPWEEFISRFHRPISLSIFRTAQLWGEASRQLVEDLVQETYLKICSDRCRLLQEFADRHPDAVAGYVKTIAANVAHDYFKGLYAQKRGAGQKQESIGDTDPIATANGPGAAKAIENEILLKQIDEYLDSVLEGPDKERDHTIFWLYYQQGMSAKSISQLPTVGLTAKGVESVIFRLTRLVRERIVNLRLESSTNDQSGAKGFRTAESY